nr:MAG TPA: ParB protein [Caudoviricetes sp.]
MKIEKINISEITEYENNAKLHPREQIEQIKKSIQEFGNNDPIAIDENNVIIEGHGRYKALQELGYDEIEVIRLSHMDDEQKRAYILAHNKLTMNSGFDIELLNSELESIVSRSWVISTNSDGIVLCAVILLIQTNLQNW